jgi:hypothetical protein
MWIWPNTLNCREESVIRATRAVGMKCEGKSRGTESSGNQLPDSKSDMALGSFDQKGRIGQCQKCHY